MRLARRLAPAAALLGAVLCASPRSAVANPNEGEARPIVRDADRVYTVVAGEGDAASTVTNPANLGFLDGVNGIVDLALMAPDRRRRGSGIGGFVGLPLPCAWRRWAWAISYCCPGSPSVPSATSPRSTAGPIPRAPMISSTRCRWPSRSRWAPGSG